jgi:hypothetical protein
MAPTFSILARASAYPARRARGHQAPGTGVDRGLLEQWEHRPGPEMTDYDPPFAILATPRIGVAYAGPEWGSRPWRFVIAPDGRP